MRACIRIATSYPLRSSQCTSRPVDLHASIITWVVRICQPLDSYFAACIRSFPLMHPGCKGTAASYELARSLSFCSQSGDSNDLHTDLDLHDCIVSIRMRLHLRTRHASRRTGRKPGDRRYHARIPQIVARGERAAYTLSAFALACACAFPRVERNVCLPMNRSASVKRKNVVVATTAAFNQTIRLQ